MCVYCKQELKSVTVVSFPFDQFPVHVRNLRNYAWKPLVYHLALGRYKKIFYQVCLHAYVHQSIHTHTHTHMKLLVLSSRPQHTHISLPTRSACSLHAHTHDIAHTHTHTKSLVYHLSLATLHSL
jgi:hypothetical protein